MPGLARKVIICAAVDGLVLHPFGSRSTSGGSKEPQQQQQQPPSSRLTALAPVRIRYGDAAISPCPASAAPDPASLPPNASFEAFGIIGLLTVFRNSYLVSITRRQQVAQLRGGMPVYVITEVALTPCATRREAEEAVAKTANALRNARGSVADEERRAVAAASAGAGEGANAPPPVASSSAGGAGSADETAAGSDEVGEDAEVGSDVETTTTGSGSGSTGVGKRSSVAQDVIERKGNYGRFAQRWFSRSGWATDQKRMMGLSAEEGSTAAVSQEAGSKANVGGAAKSPYGSDLDAPDGSEAARNLLPKLLRTTQIFFGSSKTFYFSYDIDITRRLADSLRSPSTTTPLIPLHDRVDPNYFWNRHLLRPFIDAGIDSLALPLMQGFVGQRTFVVDSHPPQVDHERGLEESVELSPLPSRAASPVPSASPVPIDRIASPVPGLRPTERRYDITLISRRSVKRAGLRYLRRGIDEDGNVANCVETEQLLCPTELNTSGGTVSGGERIYSFVQMRGSIPLFFTQSPYSLKPAPVMRHSADANFAALRKHFAGLRQRYGIAGGDDAAVLAVNLVEKHGIEAPLGEMYEQTVQRLNEEEKGQATPVGFEWFDFHAVCRGMKFENVSLLLDKLAKKLESYGSAVAIVRPSTPAPAATTEQPQGERLPLAALAAHQTGILRTNCMDCLDRTNVCQSSFAKHMLEVQLHEEGFDVAAQADQEQAWFNTLWADNGDAISKQYASTGAMKGDYTRTRKRNIGGALTDAGLSLTRLFNGMFNDFFLQASIDFLLGNVTALVFEEFEATMMTKDPAVSMQNMRQQAIELSQKRVIADESEELVGGWTMLTPRTPDTIRGPELEEAVLLLTNTALYLCRFDWDLDKVSSFERVDLAHVRRVRFGTYITSTISPTQTDEMRNVGLVVEYQPGETDITRVNTRSLSSSIPSSPSSPEAPTAAVSGIANFLSRRPAAPPPPPTRKIALKALHSQDSLVGGSGKQQEEEPGAVTQMSEFQQVVVIASEIERLAIKNQPRLEGKTPEEANLLQKGDIISLAEAKKNTTILEQLGHRVKKLVWA